MWLVELIQDEVGIPPFPILPMIRLFGLYEFIVKEVMINSFTAEEEDKAILQHRL